jgi:metal-responsive CopG/Arc/MetJ family transcriptional regulator
MVSFHDKTKIEYEKVSIPKEMINEIKRVIETDKKLGFVSLQEFVKEAVRRNIVFYSNMKLNENLSGQDKAAFTENEQKVDE